MFKSLTYSLFLVCLMMIGCKNQATETTPTQVSAADSIKLSLAQWSFHRALKSGEMNNVDFIHTAKELGFGGVEYVNQFFVNKARDTAFLDQLNAAAKANQIQQLLIMVDEEGHLGDLDSLKRVKAVENHKKWIDAAAYLGCHSIRVNAYGDGNEAEVADAVIRSMRALSDYAAKKGLNVIIENHGGYSANAEWLVEILRRADRKNIGALPDFGNFCMKRSNGQLWGSNCIEEYNKYKGVALMMPFAKGVSAKSYNFGEMGYETTIDYTKMIEIVLGAGYKGYIGVEYEGDKFSEKDGVIATKTLIEKCLNQYKNKG